MVGLRGRFDRYEHVHDGWFLGDRNRAGLGLLVSVVVLWNASYLDAALNRLGAEGFDPRDEDTARLSPLGGTTTMCGVT
jgi:hypothetical protein